MSNAPTRVAINQLVNVPLWTVIGGCCGWLFAFGLEALRWVV